MHEARALAHAQLGGSYNLDNAADLMGLVGEMTSEYRKLYDESAQSLQSADEGNVLEELDRLTKDATYREGIFNGYRELHREIGNEYASVTAARRIYDKVRQP